MFPEPKAYKNKEEGGHLMFSPVSCSSVSGLSGEWRDKKLVRITSYLNFLFRDLKCSFLVRVNKNFHFYAFRKSRILGTSYIPVTVNLRNLDVVSQ